MIPGGAFLIHRIPRGFLPGLVVLALSGGAAVSAEDAAAAFRTAGLLRVQLDYPAIASLGFGVIATRMPANFECETACLFHGVTIQGAAGLGAGEFAIGYGSLIGETTERGKWLLRHVYVGYGVRAAVVSTWGAADPGGAAFLGVEGAMTIAQFGLRLGVFHRLEPVSGQGDWRVFGGAGWGF